MADNQDKLPNEGKNKQSVMAELGDVGVRRFSGYISEEFLKELYGHKAAELYTEMASNHPVIGAMLFLIRSLSRNVEWTIEEAEPTPEEIEKADFVRSCMDDMSTPWSEVILDLMTSVVYGYAVAELCYGPRDKTRLKVDGVDTGWTSRYDDNRIGWRKIQLRAQTTIDRWDLNKFGDVIGVYQLAPERGYLYIPASKFIHVRLSGLKPSPEGTSALRNAVVSYIVQRNIQAVESIGIERDLAGLPVASMPAEYLSLEATATQKNIANDIREMMKKVRRNESDGVVIPSDKGENGEQLFDFKLLASGGSRQFDTDKIVQRYDHRIAMVMLSDFLLLGSQSVGSFALSSDKTNLFATALGGVLKQIVEAFNRDAIPKLLEMNGMDTSKTPTLKHGDIENIGLTEVMNFILGLAGAGMPMFPDPALEDFLRRKAGLPKPSTTDRAVGTGAGEVDETDQGKTPVVGADAGEMGDGTPEKAPITKEPPPSDAPEKPKGA